ncbi:MAG: sensor histidine kinase [Candidatus Nanopelagicales bacterium]
MRLERLRNISLRRRVMAATGLAVSLVVVVLVLGATYLIDAALDRDANQTLRDRTDAALSIMSVSNGKLDVEEPPSNSPLDENTWIYAGGQLVAGGRSSPAVARKVAKLADVTDTVVVELPEANTLVRAAPFMVDGTRYATVVSTLSLVPYQHTERIAMLALSGVGLVGVVGSVLLAAILVRVALRPVAVMTAQAGTWSDSAEHNRFDQGKSDDEIAGLAVTLNGLLDRLSAASLHEQRFTAEVAHELRTPLTTLLNEASIAQNHATDLAQAQQALDAVHAEALRMSGIIDTLMAMAERDADPLVSSCNLAQVLTEAARGWQVQGERCDRHVDVRVAPVPIRVGVDADYLNRIISPVIDNALAHAHLVVTIGVARSTSSAEVFVTDDGDGVARDRVEAIFEPGYRIATPSPRRGAGLGLPLARRLARGAGGDVFCESGRPTTFVIRLPAID